MPKTIQLITFRSDSALLDQAQIQKRANLSMRAKDLFSYFRDQKEINTKVTVKIMDIRWIIKGGQEFLDFLPILEKFERDNLFQTEFMKSLTHEYWMDYLKKIILRTFIPWVAYSVLSIVYFAQTLNDDFRNVDGAEKVFWKVIGVIILILIGYQLFIESKQMRKVKWNYLKSPYNYIDMY